ncbi:hypothetical protein GUJ93_ZPchr0003g18315 [Zizania palustris]|uniref:Uncharacterized protein n=1 Tax=Zizania palustris TaxID=103762 RepID=A0A8J5V6P6_ZIZPA|nr:hypothetical protein GUJ93_ZPchr0003g18315 [Zizania palustris]
MKPHSRRACGGISVSGRHRYTTGARVRARSTAGSRKTIEWEDDAAAAPHGDDRGWPAGRPAAERDSLSLVGTREEVPVAVRSGQSTRVAACRCHGVEGEAHRPPGWQRDVAMAWAPRSGLRPRLFFLLSRATCREVICRQLPTGNGLGRLEGPDRLRRDPPVASSHRMCGRPWSATGVHCPVMQIQDVDEGISEEPLPKPTNMIYKQIYKAMGNSFPAAKTCLASSSPLVISPPARRGEGTVEAVSGGPGSLPRD